MGVLPIKAWLRPNPCMIVFRTDFCVKQHWIYENLTSVNRENSHLLTQIDPPLLARHSHFERVTCCLGDRADKNSRSHFPAQLQFAGKCWVCSDVFLLYHSKNAWYIDPQCKIDALIAKLPRILVHPLRVIAWNRMNLREISSCHERSHVNEPNMAAATM